MSREIEIQERDLQLLHDLFISRVMNLTHVAKLHFGSSFEAAKKRCQKLKMAGYLKERPRRINEPGVLILTGKAIDLLSKEGALTNYPQLGLNALEKRSQVSETTIRHELAVMDVKAAIVSSLQEPFKAIEFTTWPRLIEFSIPHPRTRLPFTVKPDAYIKIHEGMEYQHTFYLELDRSTESVETLALKASSYLQYYQTGGLAVKYGKDRSAYKDYPFRVLMVFKSAERRNNVAIKLFQIPILTQVWLSTLEEVASNPLGNIWLRPIDVRTKLTDTSFTKASLKNYERYPEREAFIEKHVPKHRLLADVEN